MAEQYPAPSTLAPSETRPGQVVDRSSGSVEDFEDDWSEALRTRDPHFFAFPDITKNQQLPIIEWVKAQEVLGILHRYGFTSGTLLDYGCGAGGMSIYLHNHGYTAHLLDMSVDALKVATLNEEANKTVEGPIYKLVGDATKLPFPDGTFDIVASWGLVEHFDEASLRVLLRDVIRVLRPGGIFIADIIPGGFNARAVGTAFNFGASALFHVVRGKAKEVPELRRRYYERYFETSFSTKKWAQILREEGLIDVQVRGCRPFPPLALGGPLEWPYAALMRALLPAWIRFDNSKNFITQRWGWMYLASGLKPA